MIDLVNFDKMRLDNISSDQFKVGVTDPVRQSGFTAAEEIVEYDNIVPHKHQTVH